MVVLIPEEAENFLLKAAPRKPAPLRLVATLREDEGLVRVHSVALWGRGWVPLGASECELRGWVLPSVKGAGVDAILRRVPIGEGDTPCLVFRIDPAAGVQCYRAAVPTRLEPCQLEVVRLSTDLSLRTKGILESTALAAKRVAVIGLGSGGSIVAVELAKCCVGHFALVDYDRLKAHNISRHACGLRDVGRFKTRAVRDAILERNPSAQVECHEMDICQDLEKLQQIVAESDLVLAATDTELSKYLINEACLSAHKPAVYGGAYERAFAGEVVRVIPGETGCYACFRQGMAEAMPTSDDLPVDYTLDDDSGLRAEPGLGVDIGAIALLQVKMALLTLLRGSQSALEDIDADMIIWVNSARPQDGKLYERPLARHFVKLPPAPDCPACGAGEYFTG